MIIGHLVLYFFGVITYLCASKPSPHQTPSPNPPQKKTPFPSPLPRPNLADFVHQSTSLMYSKDERGSILADLKWSGDDW